MFQPSAKTHLNQMLPPVTASVVRAALAHSGEVFADLLKSGKYPEVTLLPLPEDERRDCAVLLLVYLKEGRPYLLAHERAADLKRFPGATAFPGGGKESGETSLQCALRECCEELGAGIPARQVLGQLPTVFKRFSDGSGFEIAPVVAFADERPNLKPNPAEAAAVVELPLPVHAAESTDSAHEKLTGISRFLYDGFCGALERARTSPTQLNIAVSFGGTKVPIDRVRLLTNDSKGTTGALISEVALRRGHLVHCVYGKDARTPFQKELTFDPKAPDQAAEARRIVEDAVRVAPYLQRAIFDPVPTFEAYQRRILELASSADYDVIIASMAASDYGPAAVEGKISSDESRLLIECEPLPKIISLIKKQRGDIFLVGFKLLINQAPDVLIERAYANLLRDKQDLAVANVGKDSMKPQNMLTYLLTPERAIVPVQREKLPETLLRLTEERLSRRYYSTKLTKVEKLPLPQTEVNDFLADCRRLAKLALFNPYLQGARQEFGFLAKRSAAGTLITGRGSSKSNATTSDVGIVTEADHEQLSLSVTSTSGKASLNASLAHHIFAARPDIRYLLHTHIRLPEAVSVGRDTSPATAEDWECVEPLIRVGHTIIEQPNHGVLLLLKDVNEAFEILRRNSVYRSHARHYDIAYHRFIRNSRLADLFRSIVPVQGKVLDLAGGTGEVSRQLLERGYHDIILADIAAPMLEVARQKLGHVLSAERFAQCSMENPPFRDTFDGIIVRQAINYLAPDKLTTALRSMRRSLRPGGHLVFNSFNAATVHERTNRFVREEVGSHILITTEGNLVDGRRVFHGQRTEMFDSFSGDYEQIYDLNSFWVYTASDFEIALRRAGFSAVTTIAEGNSLYFIGRR